MTAALAASKLTGCFSLAFDAAIFLFLLDTAIDPADRLLHAKVPLFLITVVLFLALYGRAAIQRAWESKWIVWYVLLFAGIPATSILLAHFHLPTVQSDGMSMLKGYLLIALFPILAFSERNEYRNFSYVMIFIAFLIYLIFAAMIAFPNIAESMYWFGRDNGMFYLDVRSYGPGMEMLQIYYATSPLILVSIAYLSYIFSQSSGALRLSLLFGGIVIVTESMFIAGTRANMFGAILLLLALACTLRRKIAHAVFAVVLVIQLLFGGIILNSIQPVFSLQKNFRISQNSNQFNSLSAMLDRSEKSNAIKLAYLNDYKRIFSNWETLLWGRGLGTYEFWTARNRYFPLSELTYLEIIRNFGIFGAFMMFGLLAYPFLWGFILNQNVQLRSLSVAYAIYLIACAINPNLFSSMGVTLLSICLANIYIRDRQKRGPQADLPI
ncbi:hypothetical protein [Pseudolabrys sp.]|uniref:hypothetical protein n=1 Tax=Pseudolabrys sp. TaxID=1960880 RepID=UPI003D103AB9